MYHIYMPVDLVIAITHSKMRRHNAEHVQKLEDIKRKNLERDENREKYDNLDNVKMHKCLDIFRLW